MGLFRVRARLTGPEGRGNGDEVTTPCFIAPDGPAVLGAVALESLFLAVDPTARRLVPVEGFIG
jgi:hypothetical protein